MESQRKQDKTNSRLIDIGAKTFISVLIMLFMLMVVAIVLTYVLPKGQFGVNADGTENYGEYTRIDGAGGINVLKGIFAPILMLGTSDGVNVIMLSVFLLVISGAFQVMNDVYGIKAIVDVIVDKFREKKFLLLAAVALAFMAFGSLLGLFEEMLTLLPIIVILTLSLGYDSFTGFIISIVACGFGFSSAITNPFTVIFASDIIGVNPMTNIWYRIIIFVAMYALLLLCLFLYVKKIGKNPEKSMTYERDKVMRERIAEDVIIENARKIRIAYTVFFSVILATIIIFSAVSAIRDYTVIALAAIFLTGGFACGLIASKDFKKVAKSYLKGVISALPSIIFILLASSVKYILVEGKILPTIANAVNDAVASKNPYLIALILYLIILALEFFISSSTAKAMIVMSILGIVSIGFSKETSVLIYTFADGYTNLLFPTSPVLLIGLSMIGVSYFKWLKKSAPLFIATAILVAAFVCLAIFIGY